MGKRKKMARHEAAPVREWKDRLIYSTDAAADRGEETFVNRPFRKLDGSRLALSRQGGKKKAIPPAVTDQDREMFLKAIIHPEKEKKNTPATGFTLADHCALPDLASRKAGGKASPAPAPTPPPREMKKPEEDGNAAFLLAMRKTKPLPGKGRVVVKKPILKEHAVRERDFGELVDQRLEFTLLFSDEYLEGKASGLDEMIMNRLREGQMSPEAHLDLHGLNAEQAYEAMRLFIRDAWFKSQRVVLLVPGRGKNSPAGLGILRRKVQEWLTHEPFKRVVLAFCTARPHDGGPGSIYVLLRKFRKKGHISWDRLPADADLFSS